MPQINGKEVGPFGYGMMGLTALKPQVPREQAFEALRTALARGANFWNGGEFYGTPDSNSLHLLGAYFEKYPEDADKVVISIKGGLVPGSFKTDGSPENTRRSIDDILAALGPNKKLDVFEFARRDPDVDMAVTFGVVKKEYIDTGKVGAIALSEVRAETIHEAVALGVKVACVEVELSLFSLDVIENGIAAACAQHDIPLVAYSPLGRGMLAGKFESPEDVPAQMRIMPRFQAENFGLNMELVKRVKDMSARKGCKPAQFALAWCKSVEKRQGMPTVIPIPGATSTSRIEENYAAADIVLTDEELIEIDGILSQFTVAGDRYPPFVTTNT